MAHLDVLYSVAHRAREQALRTAPSMVDVAQHMMDEVIHARKAYQREKGPEEVGSVYEVSPGSHEVHEGGR